MRVPDELTEVSFVSPIAASIAYLLLCSIGPAAMRKRHPLRLSRAMRCYNVLQIVYNAANFAVLTYGVSRNNLKFWGNSWQCGQDTRALPISAGVVMHYANKYVELLDTVFIVLRKKIEQQTWLHMYHHLLLIWSWFFVCRMPCCADTYFGAAANSAVHVLMYTYYLLKSFGQPCPWKQHITNIQMAQFIICALHSAYVLYSKNCTPTLPLVQLYVMLNMLLCFGSFYASTYLKRTESKKHEANAVLNGNTKTE